MVFDAYTIFEESMLTAKMRRAEVKADLDGDGDIELRLARLEHLLERRPILVRARAEQSRAQ
ncbi:unnamed protein product [Scytosiphon promiscuus]